jgi:hypothetical protein
VAQTARAAGPQLRELVYPVLEGPLTITQPAFDGAARKGCPNTTIAMTVITQPAANAAIACLSRRLSGVTRRVACPSIGIAPEPR